MRTTAEQRAEVVQKIESWIRNYGEPDLFARTCLDLAADLEDAIRENERLNSIARAKDLVIGGSIAENEQLEDENVELRDQLRWRKVEEELPERDVLVEFHDGRRCVGILTEFDNWFDSFDNKVWCVAHWRPLGPGPEKEGGE